MPNEDAPKQLAKCHMDVSCEHAIAASMCEGDPILRQLNGSAI